MIKIFKKNLLVLSLFLSTLLHLGLLTLISFPQSNKLNLEARKKGSLKIIEIVDLSKFKFNIGRLSQKQGRTDGKESKRGTGYGPSDLSLDQISFRPDLAPNRSVFNLNQGDRVGKFGDETGLNGNHDEGENSIYGYLYNLIGSNIKYPKFFQDKEIEGYVTVRIVISKDGTYLPRLTKIWSDSPYLKVLMSRTLNGVLKDPIPFNLDFVKNDYFLVDATFRFKADADNDEDFISANTFTSGRQLRFLIQGNDVYVAKLWLPKKDSLIFQGIINYETLIDTIHDKFTTAGKIKKMFYEQQLEAYKDDPAWNN